MTNHNVVSAKASFSMSVECQNMQMELYWNVQKHYVDNLYLNVNFVNFVILKWPP